MKYLIEIGLSRFKPMTQEKFPSKCPITDAFFTVALLTKDIVIPLFLPG